MNRKRRERIEFFQGELQSILEEEQEYFDNIPENLQESERAQQSEKAISNLEEAISLLESIE